MKNYTVETNPDLEVILAYLRHELATVETKTQEWEVQVQKAAERILGRPVVLRCSTENRLRLWNLKSWGEKYGLTLTEILTSLFEKYATFRAFQQQRHGTGLPVPVPVLTGEKARLHLEGLSLQMHPNGPPPQTPPFSRFLPGRFDAGTPEGLVEKYVEAVNRARVLTERLEHHLTRFPFRGSQVR